MNEKYNEYVIQSIYLAKCHLIVL